MSNTVGRYDVGSLSPDGTRATVTIRDPDRDVWVFNVDRGTMRPLTVADGDDFNGRWTPDGEQVIYASEQRVFQLFRIRTDGNGEPERLFTSERDNAPSSVAPDGSVVAFNENSPETGQDIWMLPLDGEPSPEPFLATQFDESNARFSPDGKWVVYESNQSGRNEVYIRAYREGATSVQVSTGGGGVPQWAASGRELFYRREDSLLAVAFDPATGMAVGDPVVLWENERWRGSYGVSPDGERFLVALTVGAPKPVEPIIIQNWFEELKRLVPTP